MSDESEFSAASHAYEHAVHAGDHPMHRVDVTDEPGWTPRPPPRLMRTATGAGRSGEHVVTHRVEAPGRAGFRLGFGFAAGVWTFRALVIVAGWTILAVVISALLTRAFPF